MTQGQIGMIITIIVYLAGMITIGMYFGKRASDSSGDYFLGGRRMGPLVTAMSAEASDMSSWLLMGLPGVAYLSGIADAGWTAIGLAVGTYLNWLFVAKKLRRYTIKVNAITVPEFFSARYHDKKNILACIAALCILIFFIPYTASGFKAIGTLFNSLFGANYHAAMILGALVVIGYTVIGGFMAVSTTDLMQSIVMTIALVVIVFFGVSCAGGWANVADNALNLMGYLKLTQMHDFASGTSVSYGFITIVSTMAWGFGYFGMPHILLRFMAIRDEKELTTSRRIGSIWVVISMGVAILIGVIGNAAAANGALPLLTTSSEAETVVVLFSELLSHNGFIPAMLAGIVIAGILASTMSTADSQLLTAASSVSEDLVSRFFGIKLSDKKTLLIARATVVVISLIAIGLAWNPNSSVFQIVSFAWAGFGAAFGPVVLFALFWKRSNMKGALVGMVSGGVMVFVWKFLVRPIGGAWNIYELLPAFLVASAAIVIVSLLTKAPDAQVEAEYDSIQ